ncbi:MAG: diaminopimelate decarboxylase [Solirubrobacteraceae bacterium]|nr:diaminopimelate decarboxylase [Solirubrobacteraceae bacterium]
MAETQLLENVYPIGSRINELGRLEVGGCDVVELASEFGTPSYIVAEDDMRARARGLQAAFGSESDDFELIFASKAFPCAAVCALFAEEGFGCDVASAGEMAIALAGGVPAAKIQMHGNAKSELDLERAVEVGIGAIVVDNLRDLDRLERLAGRSAKQRIYLRIAPGVSPDTHPAISTGGPNTKFGFDLEHAPAAIARAQQIESLDLAGLHFHIGSQIFDLSPFEGALRSLASLGDFRSYNLGGGLAAAYTAQDRPPSYPEYAAAKAGALESVFGPGHRLLDEPGRALVANGCVTLYSVESVKRNVDTYVAVDGGMSDNLRPMLYGARYEAQIADRFGGGTACHLVGKHCESGDILIRDADLNQPAAGDLVVVPATGAYGHAMANNYNGALRPPVIFASGGDARVVVRRESDDDLLVRDV